MGYHVLATNTVSHNQGVVALSFRNSSYWQVEESVFHGPNIISAMLVSGNKKFGIVGAYAPPKNTRATVHIAVALGHFPNNERKFW